MTKFKINMTSDITCPWCYIGHGRLMQAIKKHKSQFPTDEFHLRYFPFYINEQAPSKLTSNGKPAPPFPVQSRPRRELYNSKFGASGAKIVHAQLDQAGAELGYHLKYDGMTGPSKNGHRLAYWAREKAGETAQNAVMEKLWKRHLEEEVDVTKLEVLTEVGVEAGCGMDEEVKRFLLSGKYGDEIDMLVDQARRKGVASVPLYVLQDTWAVSGAQKAESFEGLFARVKVAEEKKGVTPEQKETEVDTTGAIACTRDGCL